MQKITTRVTVLALLSALFAVAAYSRAQNTPPAEGPSNNRVAVISFHRIFNEAKQIGDLNDDIRKREQDFQAEAERRKKVIEEKTTELTAFRPGTPDYEARRKDLVRLNIESSVWFQTTEAEIERLKFDWTKLIYERAIEVAGQLAAERGYDAVLQYKEYNSMMIDPNVTAMRRVIQDRDVVYHRRDIDITADVLQRMDQSYQTQPRPAAGGSSPTPMGNP